MDGYSPLGELNPLSESGDGIGGGFADACELYEYNRPDAGLVAWLAVDPTGRPELARYLDRLVPFAPATGSGSFYALWRCDDRSDLATLPVVLFGSEGELDVVASGVLELFPLLAPPAEEPPPAAGEAERGHRRPEYLAWPERTFGRPAPDTAEAVLARARAEYGPRFLAWMREFVPEEALSSLRDNLDR
ncbi:hypothetical protein E0L36_22745 [Streptomyces sp. AJS327]|uniref:hypothetical protein n=1 Tax=Streptomyces sp. AJS327 TaxID=2545265 RepID=UPI0015DEB2A5|nr:hypothetical protein [Streptomyces sp. AJS327]MBA0053590.1 hypothetical protein [Streptomyces sp. AJS327]